MSFGNRFWREGLQANPLYRIDPLDLAVSSCSPINKRNTQYTDLQVVPGKWSKDGGDFAKLGNSRQVVEPLAGGKDLPLRQTKCQGLPAVVGHQIAIGEAAVIDAMANRGRRPQRPWTQREKLDLLAAWPTSGDQQRLRFQVEAMRSA